jgi:hypothetical protein
MEAHASTPAETLGLASAISVSGCGIEQSGTPPPQSVILGPSKTTRAVPPENPVRPAQNTSPGVGSATPLSLNATTVDFTFKALIPHIHIQQSTGMVSAPPMKPIHQPDQQRTLAYHKPQPHYTLCIQVPLHDPSAFVHAPRAPMYNAVSASGLSCNPVGEPLVGSSTAQATTSQSGIRAATRSTQHVDHVQLATTPVDPELLRTATAAATCKEKGGPAVRSYKCQSKRKHAGANGDVAVSEDRAPKRNKIVADATGTDDNGLLTDKDSALPTITKPPSNESDPTRPASPSASQSLHSAAPSLPLALQTTTASGSGHVEESTIDNSVVLSLQRAAQEPQPDTQPIEHRPPATTPGLTCSSSPMQSPSANTPSPPPLSAPSGEPPHVQAAFDIPKPGFEWAYGLNLSIEIFDHDWDYFSAPGAGIRDGGRNRRSSTDIKSATQN